MKIFGWVNRHFHHKDAKKVGDEKVALLENEAFASACDVWKEGILAIGTLGIDLLQDYKAKDGTSMNNEVLFFGDVDDDHIHDHDHDNDHDHDHDHDEEMECPDFKHGFDRVKEQDLPPFDENVTKPKNGQEDGGTKDLTKIRKHGERTTLADLLRADSEKNFQKTNGLSHDHKMKVPFHDNNTGTESIKSFLILKKKTKLVKDDSAQPMKKTKQLIKKMLKKKIHPDKTGIQKKTTSVTTQEIDMHAR